MINPFDYVTEKDLVYASILGFLLLFLSFTVYVRFEPTELPGVYYASYGYPFGWVRTKSHLTYWFIHDVEILWQELFLDFIVWFLLSLILIYAWGILREKYS